MHVYDSLNELNYLPVLPLPEREQWGYYVTASWVPHHEHYWYVIR